MIHICMNTLIHKHPYNDTSVGKQFVLPLFGAGLTGVTMPRIIDQSHDEAIMLSESQRGPMWHVYKTFTMFDFNRDPQL